MSENEYEKHCKFFVKLCIAPEQWKVGTLSGMIRRAYEICSNKYELTKELTHLKHVFTTTNGYPKFLVESLLKKAKASKNEASETS